MAKTEKVIKRLVTDLSTGDGKWEVVEVGVNRVVSINMVSLHNQYWFVATDADNETRSLINPSHVVFVDYVA